MVGTLLSDLLVIGWTVVLRAGPQDLRAPRAMLAVALPGYWTVEVALLTHTSDGPLTALAVLVALRVALIAAFVWGWVALAGHAGRFVATLAALLALGALAQAAKLPLLPIAPGTPRWLLVAPGLILAWQLVVSVHVLRQAVPRSWLEAAVIVVVMQVASWSLPTTILRVVTGTHIRVRHATPHAGWDGRPRPP